MQLVSGVRLPGRAIGMGQRAAIGSGNSDLSAGRCVRSGHKRHQAGLAAVDDDSQSGFLHHGRHEPLLDPQLLVATRRQIPASFLPPSKSGHVRVSGNLGAIQTDTPTWSRNLP